MVARIVCCTKKTVTFRAFFRQGRGIAIKFSSMGKVHFPILLLGINRKDLTAGARLWIQMLSSGGDRWEPSRKLELKNQVLYELHIGTFAADGTYQAAESEFPRLTEF